MAVVKINTNPPKKVNVRGIAATPPGEIEDINGLQTALNNLIAQMATKASLTAEINAFQGIMKLLGDGKRALQIGDVRPGVLQELNGYLYICNNCVFIQNEALEFECIQLDSGKASYLILGHGVFAFYSTTENGGSAQVVIPSLIFQANLDGSIDVRRPELVIDDEEVNQGVSDHLRIVVLDASENPVNYILNPALSGITLEIFCADHTNGAEVSCGSNTIFLKNDPENGVNNFSLYKGDSIRLYFNGTSIKQL